MEDLKRAIKKSEAVQGKHLVQESQGAITIVKKFIAQNNLIVYGGAALNAHMPKSSKIYNYEEQVPDFDMYSPNAVQHTKDLTDTLYKQGYSNAHAKAAVHVGTFKVYANHINVADISHISKKVYNLFKKDAVRMNDGILYSSIRLLRMNLYSEMSVNSSAPRWEKVFSRLTLFNQHYPIENTKAKHVDCQTMLQLPPHKRDGGISPRAHNDLKATLVKVKAVFVGHTATHKLLPDYNQDLLGHVFDVLHPDPNIVLQAIIKSHSQYVVTHKVKDSWGEFIPSHIVVSINGKLAAIVFETAQVHTYNIIDGVRIATTDTLMTFYLAFTIIPLSMYDPDRALCLCIALTQKQKQHLKSDNRMFRRFTIGTNDPMTYSRSHIMQRKNDLKSLNLSDEQMEFYFMKYTPT
jgi:hypothetical protein